MSGSGPDPYSVAANERETVRVFAVDLDPPQAKAWATVHHNIETALGTSLDAEHIESFPAADLKGLGLAQFLIDGYGIAEAEIAPDRDRLDAAGPYLLLLRARAFRGQAAVLAPRTPLVPLGAYAQAGAERSRPTPPRETETAEIERPAPPEPLSPRRGSLLPLLIFLCLAAILFAVLILPKL